MTQIDPHVGFPQRFAEETQRDAVFYRLFA